MSDVFVKCIDLRDYLQKCYVTAILGNSSVIPSCYIRLDISHLINMVAKWKCLKAKDKILVRAFYLRCIGQAYQMVSFKELEFFMESILSVALSKSIGCTSDGKSVPADLRMNYLNNIIKGNTNINNKIEVIMMTEDEEEKNDNEESPETEFDIHKPNPEITNWIEWNNSILDSAQKIATDSENGHIINACYNLEFAKQIKIRLLPYLPIWTGIMRPYFNRSGEIATSSSVEAEFSDLKCRGFKGRLPMRVDKFVIEHLEHLDTKISLVCNERDNESDNFTGNAKKKILSGHFEQKENDIFITNSINNTTESLNDSTNYKNNIDSKEGSSDCSDNHIWNISENWQGLVRSNDIKNEQEDLKPAATIRSKPSYLNKCPEWDYLKNTKSLNLPMIINGSKCKPVK